jgi:hypothetical protein
MDPAWMTVRVVWNCVIEGSRIVHLNMLATPDTVATLELELIQWASTASRNHEGLLLGCRPVGEGRPSSHWRLVSLGGRLGCSRR